ncbi:hypothetical protein Btru_028260 [Bulinus truncatus]|nr:hypothetical protein Btru_028260 [Bulinus truncatus]
MYGHAGPLLGDVTVYVTRAGGVKGINCDCDTVECKDNGKTSCLGQMCYTELHNNVITRGCDPTPLACENRKPVGIGNWPNLFCCKDKNFCNKYVVPIGPVHGTIAPATTEDQVIINHLTETNCSSSSSSSDPQHRGPTTTTRLVNPIYIAVPVAGVCVLLALVIFAMYLLRRRTDYHHHDNFLRYQNDVAATLGQNKQGIAPHHHCQCTCKTEIVAPPCSKGNRCTDSERSSSGSETKLFLQT